MAQVGPIKFPQAKKIARQWFEMVPSRLLTLLSALISQVRYFSVIWLTRLTYTLRLGLFRHLSTAMLIAVPSRQVGRRTGAGRK